MRTISRSWNGALNKQILNKHIFGSSLLLEQHGKRCPCLYCKGDYKIHYGLNIPSNWKAWNSWYVIKIFPRIYLRWTNRWFKFFVRKK